jgi:hypothetical protein
MPLNSDKFAAWFDEFRELTDGFAPVMVIGAKVTESTDPDEDAMEVSIAVPVEYDDERKIVLLMLALLQSIDTIEGRERRASFIQAVLRSMMDSFPKDTLTAAHAMIRNALERRTRDSKN